MYSNMHEYTRLFAPFTSKEPGICDGWFANKKSGIDFSQLKPDPSLHPCHQRHWCSASKQTAACYTLQDATIPIYTYMTDEYCNRYLILRWNNPSVKGCWCRSRCQPDEKLLEKIICISTLFRQQICGMVCLSTRFHTQHSGFVVMFFCGSPHCLVGSCHSLIALPLFFKPRWC